MGFADLDLIYTGFPATSFVFLPNGLLLSISLPLLAPQVSHFSHVLQTAFH